MTTDELLAKLPHMIGRNRLTGGGYIQRSGEEQAIGWFTLTHESNKGFEGSGDWCAAYECVEGGYVCLNYDDPEPPYNNAVAYGDTAHEAIQELYNWCVKNGFIKENK